jgi:hypothetical protein
VCPPNAERSAPARAGPGSYDSIQASADRAKNEVADIILESWEDMNHVFQIFGWYASESAEALQRLGEVTNVRVRKGKKTKNCFDLNWHNRSEGPA